MSKRKFVISLLMVFILALGAIPLYASDDDGGQVDDGGQIDDDGTVDDGGSDDPIKDKVKNKCKAKKPVEPVEDSDEEEQPEDAKIVRYAYVVVPKVPQAGY